MLGIKGRVLSPPAALSPATSPAEAAAPANGDAASVAEPAAGDSSRAPTLAARSAPPPGFGPPPGFPAQSHTKAPPLANGSVAGPPAEVAGSAEAAAEPGHAAVSSPASVDGGAVSSANGVVSPQQSPLKGRNSFLRSLRTRAAEGGGDGAGDPPAAPVSAPAPVAVATEHQTPHLKAATFGEGVSEAVVAKLAASHLAPPGFHVLQQPAMANGHHHQAGSRTAAAAEPRGGAVLGLPAEEEAFLRSLGWSEGAGSEDGGLTDAEIAAYRVRHSFAVR